MMELLDGLDAAGLRARSRSARASRSCATSSMVGPGGRRGRRGAGRPDALPHLRRARPRDRARTRTGRPSATRARPPRRRQRPKTIEPLVPDGDELDARGRRVHRRLRRRRRRDRRDARPAGPEGRACSRRAATSTSPTSTSSSSGPTRTCTGAAARRRRPTSTSRCRPARGSAAAPSINWTNCLRTRPWVREQWAREHGLEGVDGPDFDRHLDAVFERLSVNDRCSDLNGPQQRMKEGADALGWSLQDDRPQRRRRALRPGVRRLHGLRRPVRLQAVSTQKTFLHDAVDARRRHRRALLRRARAGRERPRGRRRGHLDRPRDRAHARA